MAKQIFVSIRSIKLHELHTTLRHMAKRDEQWSDIYLRLGEINAELTSTLVKSASGLLVFYLLLSSISDPYLMSVTVQGVTASVPTAFPLLVASILFYFFCLQLQAILMLLWFRSERGSRPVRRGFSPSAFGFLMKQDEMAIVLPIHFNGFVREKYRVSEFLEFQIIFVIFLFLVPVVGIFLFLTSTTFDILLAHQLPVLYWTIAYLAAVVLFFTFFYVIAFNIPLPVERSSFSIRWGFLTMLNPAEPHARIDEFLADEEVSRRQ